MRPCRDHDRMDCPMTRINRVNGQGPIPCSIMLIGEAPGKNEDAKGQPLIGKSGSELDHLYLGECARLDRANVYVTNLVKCLTNDKDRDPSPAEIQACTSILADELYNVMPRYVGTVGRLSTQWLIGDVKMEKAHGFGYKVAWGLLDLTVMPLYHPAYGLHNTPMMRHIMADFTAFGRMVRGDENVMWKEGRRK